jgi:hypothetical protein
MDLGNSEVSYWPLNLLFARYSGDTVASISEQRASPNQLNGRPGRCLHSDPADL